MFGKLFIFNFVVKVLLKILTLNLFIFVNKHNILFSKENINSKIPCKNER